MKAEISATTPDWSREACHRWWDPGPRLLRSLRDYQKWRGGGRFGRLLSPFCVLRNRFWSVVSGADIPLNCSIQGGLMLPHPNGVVVHPDSRIGPNCILFQQVTLGTGGKLAGCPTLGGDVFVGAGAKILGGVTIGDHARIGANAVVLNDVPGGATAVGIPARVRSDPE